MRLPRRAPPRSSPWTSHELASATGLGIQEHPMKVYGRGVSRDDIEPECSSRVKPLQRQN
jgi:hypothetical protein